MSLGSSVRPMPRRAVGPSPRAWLKDADAQGNDEDGKRDSQFGVLDDPGWKDPDPTDFAAQADLRSAKQQHQLSQDLRERIRRSGTPIETVAEHIGMSPDGLRRILNGTAHVTLTDLSRIAGALGRELQITLHQLPDEDSRTPPD